MAAVRRRIHFHPRPAIIVSAVLAVVALTAPLAAILQDDRSLRLALIGLVAGLASLGISDGRRKEGRDVVRLFGATGALLAVPAALLALAPSLDADVQRLAGADRVATALAVSEHLYDTSEAVIIVDARSSADAVAAAPLAAEMRGPLLLAGDGVTEEIERLEARRAFLVGAAASAPELQDQLRGAGISEIVRIAGPDRYATSAAVAARIRPERVYVASGWPDAIAVTPLAADGGAIVTVPSDAVPPTTIRALQRIEPEQVVVVGGEAAIGEDVLTFLEELLPEAEVSRLAGVDRWATSLEAFEQSGLSGNRVWIASGSSWPDALAAATGAAAEGRPVLLVPSEGASPSAASVRWLLDHRTDLKALTIVGGDAAVDQRLVDRITVR